MKQLITPEIKNALLSNQLLPTYREIAKHLGVSLSIVYKVMNGQSANRKVVNFILNTVSKKNKELSQFGQSVLNN